MQQTTKVAAQYLLGRFISMAFLAIFYAIGFSIIGMENAVLISLIAVLPTIIPYVGGIHWRGIPILIAFVSGSAGMVIPVMGVTVIDNNLIEPIVMGKKLNISHTMAIFAIVLGELIWGISGMILFEPLFAIIRIICEHVPKLHPYSFLLEDDVDEPEWIGKIKHVFSKK